MPIPEMPLRAAILLLRVAETTLTRIVQQLHALPLFALV